MRKSLLIFSLIFSVGASFPSAHGSDAMNFSVNPADGDADKSYDAAVMHPNGKAYFFRDSEYTRYAFNPDNLEKVGQVNVDGWKGLSIAPGAAVSHPNGKTYFFSAETYQRFNHVKDQVDGTARIGIDGWKGVPAFVDSAVNHPNGKAYFFKDSKFYQFDFKADKVEKIGTIGVDGWRGVPAKTTAAILHPNGKVYFFINDLYYRFDFATDEVDKIGTIGVDGWEGLAVSNSENRMARQYATTVVNSNSSQCLAIGSRSVESGKNAIQWTCGSGGESGNPEQEWLFTEKAGGTEIINMNSGLCLTIPGGKKDNAVPAVQLPCDGGLEQRWILSDDNLRMINARTKKCLAIGSANLTRGVNAIQWPCNSGSNGNPEQDWKREFTPEADAGDDVADDFNLETLDHELLNDLVERKPEEMERAILQIGEFIELAQDGEVTINAPKSAWEGLDQEVVAALTGSVQKSGVMTASRKIPKPIINWIKNRLGEILSKARKIVGKIPFYKIPVCAAGAQLALWKRYRNDMTLIINNRSMAIYTAVDGCVKMLRGKKI